MMNYIAGGPGSHVAVLAGRSAVGVEGRLLGLELRDTLLVLRAGPTVGFVFLFRVPLTEPTVAEQTLRTGTGGLNIGACRVGTESTRRQNKAEMGYHGGNLPETYSTGSESGRWPPNVLFVHGPGCKKIDVWECGLGCPVALLDESDDSSGASRFYPQFDNERALLVWLRLLLGDGAILRDSH